MQEDQVEEWKNICGINDWKYDAEFVIIIFSEPIPDSGMNKIGVGTAGLLLGLTISVAGLIYYKKKSAGERWILINIEINIKI